MIGCPVSYSLGRQAHGVEAVCRPRVSSRFPSLYSFTVGHTVLLGFEDGPPIFHHPVAWNDVLINRMHDRWTTLLRISLAQGSVRDVSPAFHRACTLVARGGRAARRGRRSFPPLMPEPGSFATTAGLSVDYSHPLLRWFTSRA